MPARRSTFRLAISVTVSVTASADTVWRLLTDLDAHSRWNSTVTRIEGQVAVGQKLSFEVPQAPGQKFTPTVITCDPPVLLAWRINRWPLLIGDRSYRLTPRLDGSTDFTMTEVLRGLLLPLAARSGLDFVRMVEQTAADLVAACDALGLEPGAVQDRERG